MGSRFWTPSFLPVGDGVRGISRYVSAVAAIGLENFFWVAGTPPVAVANFIFTFLLGIEVRTYTPYTP